MKPRTRLKPAARKESLLAAALPLAEVHGYANLTRKQITEAADVTGPVLNHYFSTMTQFRRDLMRYAVRAENLAVIAQGLSAGDTQAKKADEGLRRRALEALL